MTPLLYLQKLKDYATLKSQGFELIDTWSGQDNLDLLPGELSRLRFELEEQYWVNKENNIACAIRQIKLDNVIASSETFEEEKSQVRASFNRQPRRIFTYSTLERGNELITGNLNLMEIAQGSRVYQLKLGKDHKKTRFYNVQEVNVARVLAQHRVNIENLVLNSESNLLIKFRDALSNAGYRLA